MTDQRQVSLIRQDKSDCQNTTVDDDPERQVGTVIVRRGDDGMTEVEVDCTLRPDTIYAFNLKCVRRIGGFMTGDEGTARSNFRFRTDEVGDAYAFDCHQETAVDGDIYQSVTVKFS